MTARLGQTLRLALPLGLIAGLSIAFPLAWFAPLMTVKVSFAFWASGNQVSLISTLQSLWAEDPTLGLLLSFLTLAAPMLKLIGMALILTGLASPKIEGALWALGRLAMADVFLITVYIAIFKGLDIGHIRIEWGLWLYTGAVVTSLLLSLWMSLNERKRLPRHENGGKIRT